MNESEISLPGEPSNVAFRIGVKRRQAGLEVHTSSETVPRLSVSSTIDMLVQQ
jgi:hypothetical protein